MLLAKDLKKSHPDTTQIITSGNNFGDAPLQPNV